MTSDVPSTVLRTAALLKKQPVSWHQPTGGYTPADRYVVRFADGTSAFAKAATDEYTAAQLLAEYRLVYSKMSEPYLPRLLSWDAGALPLMVLEDLSHASWPPPWDKGQVHAVLQALDTIHATKVNGLRLLGDIEGKEDWLDVQKDPRPFLSLKLVSQAWLENALPILLAAARAAQFEGEAFLHVDVRSDNICFVEGRALLVDWNFACRGNADIDIASWLPSLQSEGGPSPEEILPHAPEWAAFMSGYFAAHAGLPSIPNAPRVRQVQLSQLRSALPWAQRALGLPPLDGPAA
jgi:hypothetical protein